MEVEEDRPLLAECFDEFGANAECIIELAADDLPLEAKAFALLICLLK